MGDVDDLAAWLLERIAEDEDRAQQMRHLNVDDGGYYSCPATRPTGTKYGNLPSGEEHCDCGMPAERRRLLAECEAKRRIVALHSDAGPSQGYTGTGYGELDAACGTCGEHGEYGVVWPCDTIRSFTLPFVDRPGYREEWRPV